MDDPEQPPILEIDRILETIVALERRVGERFPDSGLRSVCKVLLQLGEKTRGRIEWVQRPNLALRALVVLLIALIAVGLAAAFLSLKRETGPLGFIEVVQAVESGINDAVFLGIAVFFLWTIERRIKRARILRAIHELRSLAHVVDMHQLTKDPARSIDPTGDTASSPKRTLTPFELTRYLDYCTEVLSLIGKVSVVYIQSIDDSAVLHSAGEVETLTTGLSRKIWQKLMILELRLPGLDRPSTT